MGIGQPIVRTRLMTKAGFRSLGNSRTGEIYSVGNNCPLAISTWTSRILFEHAASLIIDYSCSTTWRSSPFFCVHSRIQPKFCSVDRLLLCKSIPLSLVSVPPIVDRRRRPSGLKVLANCNSQLSAKLQHVGQGRRNSTRLSYASW